MQVQRPVHGREQGEGLHRRDSRPGWRQKGPRPGQRRRGFHCLRRAIGQGARTRAGHCPAYRQWFHEAQRGVLVASASWPHLFFHSLAHQIVERGTLLIALVLYTALQRTVPASSPVALLALQCAAFIDLFHCVQKAVMEQPITLRKYFGSSRVLPNSI